jgi:hypothetical protein
MTVSSLYDAVPILYDTLCHIVTIMALPRSDGFDAILVIIDKLSMSLVLIPTLTTVTAKETARLYFDKFYCRHGMACKIISERNARFTGAFWQELHRLLHVRLAMPSPFHPQTDGQIERANRTLEEMIRHYVAHKQDAWSRLIRARFRMQHQSTPGHRPDTLLCLDRPRTGQVR